MEATHEPVTGTGTGTGTGGAGIGIGSGQRDWQGFEVNLEVASP